MGENINTEELVEFNGRQIYPEVAEYIRTKRASDRAYEDAIAEADYAFRKAEREMRRLAEDEERQFDSYSNREDERRAREARQARSRAYEEAERAKRIASSELLLNSPHPVVKWIAENCLFAGQGSEVEGYALDILKILPATTEQIWEEAKDNRGMCEVFDQFYDRAEQAGLFNEGKAPAGARELAALRNYIRRNYGHGYVRDFMPQIERVMKAIREDADKRLAEAKAEWQGLDEAYRSERSRRAAATRRANAEQAQGTPVPEPVNMTHPERPVVMNSKAPEFV